MECRRPILVKNIDERFPHLLILLPEGRSFLQRPNFGWEQNSNKCILRKMVVQRILGTFSRLGDHYLDFCIFCKNFMSFRLLTIFPSQEPGAASLFRGSQVWGGIAIWRNAHLRTNFWPRHRLQWLGLAPYDLIDLFYVLQKNSTKKMFEHKPGWNGW